MPRAEKMERVAELKGRIEASDALLLTEYRGLTVSDISTLRRSLAEGGTRFSVVKNTLMQRAVAGTALDDLVELLAGPSAVAFVAGDPVAAAKTVVDAARRYPMLVLKGGYLDGKVLSADEARSLADLESRDVMLSKVAGLVKNEISRAAAVLVSAQAKFLSLLEAFKEKVPGEEVEEVQEVQEVEEVAAREETGAREETSAREGTDDGEGTIESTEE